MLSPASPILPTPPAPLRHSSLNADGGASRRCGYSASVRHYLRLCNTSQHRPVMRTLFPPLRSTWESPPRYLRNANGAPLPRRATAMPQHKTRAHKGHAANPRRASKTPRDQQAGTRSSSRLFHIPPRELLHKRRRAAIFKAHSDRQEHPCPINAATSSLGTNSS